MSKLIVADQKVNESSAISNVEYTATSTEMKISFDFDNTNASLVPATKDGIGGIAFPDSSVSEQIPADVETDYFGNEFWSKIKIMRFLTVEISILVLRKW